MGLLLGDLGHHIPTVGRSDGGSDGHGKPAEAPSPSSLAISPLTDTRPSLLHTYHHRPTSIELSTVQLFYRLSIASPFAQHLRPLVPDSALSTGTVQTPTWLTGCLGTPSSGLSGHADRRSPPQSDNHLKSARGPTAPFRSSRHDSFRRAAKHHVSES